MPRTNKRSNTRGNKRPNKRTNKRSNKRTNKRSNKRSNRRNNKQLGGEVVIKPPFNITYRINKGERLQVQNTKEEWDSLKNEGRQPYRIWLGPNIPEFVSYPICKIYNGSTIFGVDKYLPDKEGASCDIRFFLENNRLKLTYSFKNQLEGQLYHNVIDITHISVRNKKVSKPTILTKINFDESNIEVGKVVICGKLENKNPETLEPYNPPYEPEVQDKKKLTINIFTDQGYYQFFSDEISSKWRNNNPQIIYSGINSKTGQTKVVDKMCKNA